MKDFVVCYGMTETSPVTFQGFCSDDMSLKTSTVGFPSNHQEMAVMDTEGRIVEAGVEGELVTRGYSTMLGYWDDKEKTDEVRGQHVYTRRQFKYHVLSQGDHPGPLVPHRGHGRDPGERVREDRGADEGHDHQGRGEHLPQGG